MKTVMLKNGIEESMPLVTITMLSLQKLMCNCPSGFRDLVMKCRDKNHDVSSSIITLISHDLMDWKQSVRNNIRNIVVSAVEGEGKEMRLVSPIKE